MSASTIAVKNFDTPEETRRFDHGRAAVVEIAGMTVGRMTFDVGWRWSLHLKAAAGTESCRARHTGYLLSGRLGARMDDGTQVEAGPGDFVVISPGHDGWVIGDEPCVMLDWTGLAPKAP